MGILSTFRFAFQNIFFTPVLYGVIASLAVFSATWEKGDRLKDQLTDSFRNQDDTFDFIIVGGGTAGAVLANRLSEAHTVLLLEAGGESHPFGTIPALSLFLTNYPAVDWSHKTVTQTTSCLICKDKKYTFSQGKNLGGSGNLNYLIYLRGSPKDFDNWARITGDQTWSYEGVKPNFCASEHFVGTTTDASAHAVGGPLQIEMPSEIGLANEWNWAGQEMGYQHLDLNGQYEEGFDAVYYPIKHGKRQATYRAFIEPVRQRSSLIIRKFAHVNKVLIKEASNDAYGVQYDRHGKSFYVFASKEVILSAGTLQTPKILMLSGIGPAANLEPFKIPVKSDLPVGKNLHDHISTLLGPFFINSKKTFSFDDDVTANSFLEFYNHGRGCLTTSGFQAAALLTSSYAKAKGQPGWPDIQLTLFGVSPHRMFSSDLAHSFGLKEGILQRYLLHARRKSAFFILVSVARPESRGEFCISSADPHKPPVIDPKFFTDPGDYDISVMIEGVNRALFLAENTTAFQSLGTHFTSKCFPGCENHVFRSPGYWDCYIRHFTLTLGDQVGTAQMGFKGSPYAVVDPELQVMGVNNLRVIDASVMPTIVGANTQASTVMIAEKGSSFILRKWINQAKDFGMKSQYGPPALPISESSGTSSGGNFIKVVTDDAIQLLQPPFTDAYQNFDSFQNQNQQISSTPFNFYPSPGPSLSPEEFLTQIQVPQQQQGGESYPLPISYPQTPQLYNQVYEPVIAGSYSSTAFPLSQSSSTGQPFYQSPNQSQSQRGSKALNFIASPSPNSLLSQDSQDDDDGESSQDFSTTTESTFIRRGNSSLIIRRRKRPPNVTVHPRGHLRYEDVTRRPRPSFSTLSSSSTTNIIPLPRESIVVKRRRLVNPTRRPRQSTTFATSNVETDTATDASNSANEEEEEDQNPSNLTDPEVTTRRARFVLSNSTRVASSVSRVINRLRNFIPPSTNTKINGGGIASLRDKRNHQEEEEDLQEEEKEEKQPEEAKKNFKKLKNKTSTEEPFQEEFEEPEMIIFSDVEVEGEATINNGKNKQLVKSFQEEDSSSPMDHPFMLIDMNPMPEISINSPSYLNLSNSSLLLSNSKPIRKRKRLKRIRKVRINNN